ncbi:MAG: hypothetical protein QW478_15785 [Candidatus Micrarchaeaceae archaeon]
MAVIIILGIATSIGVWLPVVLISLFMVSVVVSTLAITWMRAKNFVRALQNDDINVSKT